jgi:colanic acid/amylovoran biosynthesis glycosyltransferase
MNRVVYVTSSFPYGNGESFVSTEVKSLIKENIDIIVVPVYPRGKLIQDSKKNTNPSIQYPLFSLKIFFTAAKVFCFRFLAVVSITRQIIYSGKSVVTTIKNLLILPKSLWLADFVVTNKVGHIHAHWLTTPSTLAMIASEISGVPWSFTAHRGDIIEQNLIDMKLARSSFSRFISERSFELVKQLSNCTLTGREIILHMGVTLEQNVPAVKTSYVNQQFNVLCAANLLPVKGHKYLIDAIKILFESDEFLSIKLIIAGSGHLEKDIISQINNLGLEDKIELVGHLSHDGLLNMYRKSLVDIFVLPSIDLGNGLHEGIPVSLIEAMSFNVPVVSTMTGGIPELLMDQAGILVKDKDSLALANAIKLLMEDNSLKCELVRNARGKVINEFDVTVIASRLNEMFEKFS